MSNDTNMPPVNDTPVVSDIPLDALSEASDLGTRHLLFYIDNLIYGVPLSLVLEIIQVPRIIQVPMINDHIKGIINLRGKVIPVVSVRRKFHLPEEEHVPNAKISIVVLDIEGVNVGLVVDSVSEVATFDDRALSEPPASTNFSSKFLSSIAELKDKVVLNIDFDKFFQEDMQIHVE